MRDRLTRMRWMVAVVLAIETPASAEPPTETSDAFDRYVAATERAIDRRVEGREPFLWIDGLPAADRARVLGELPSGATVVERPALPDGESTTAIRDGMVHHWVGAIVIPGVSVADAVALFQDYARYAEVYAPRVTKSRLIEHRSDGRYRVYLQLWLKKILAVTLNTEYEIVYRRLSNGRVHVTSRSTRVAEVEDAGTPAEREKPAGDDRGFLWRLNNYCSFEERASDTYMTCEMVSLSRDVPFLLGPIVRPFVSSVPRESLALTLEATRDRLLTSKASTASGR